MKCIVCHNALGSRSFNTDQNSSSTGDRLIFRLYEIFKEEVTGSLCSVCHTLLEEYDNYRYCLQGTASQVILRRKCHEVKGSKESVNNTKDLASEAEHHAQDNIGKEIVKISITKKQADKGQLSRRYLQPSNGMKLRNRKKFGKPNVDDCKEKCGPESEKVDDISEEESDRISNHSISWISDNEDGIEEAEKIITKSFFLSEDLNDTLQCASTKTVTVCDKDLYGRTACDPDMSVLSERNQMELESDLLSNSVDVPIKLEAMDGCKTMEERREEQTNIELQNNDQDMIDELEHVAMKIGSSFQNYTVFTAALKTYYSKPGLEAGYKTLSSKALTSEFFHPKLFPHKFVAFTCGFEECFWKLVLQFRTKKKMYYITSGHFIHVHKHEGEVAASPEDSDFQDNNVEDHCTTYAFTLGPPVLVKQEPEHGDVTDRLGPPHTEEEEVKCTENETSVNSSLPDQRLENTTNVLQCLKGKKKLLCQQCGKRFPKKCNLSRHIKNVHYISELKKKQKAEEGTCRKCEHCGRTFKAKYNLKRHIKEVHGNTTKLKCTACESEFTRKLRLKQHFIRCHEKQEINI